MLNPLIIIITLPINTVYHHLDWRWWWQWWFGRKYGCKISIISGQMLEMGNTRLRVLLPPKTRKTTHAGEINENSPEHLHEKVKPGCNTICNEIYDFPKNSFTSSFLSLSPHKVFFGKNLLRHGTGIVSSRSFAASYLAELNEGIQSLP